ncbi:hypothetical protein P9112_006160 [Eukaryota sp. TZLM1-RC]
MLDGWTDVARRPLINILVVSSEGAMFFKSMNCHGEFKDHSLIARELSDVIEEIGPTNVTQLITDNARPCVKAGEFLTMKYPSITWTPCHAHMVDLFLENTAKLSCVKEIRSCNARQLVKLILNNDHLLGILHKRSQKELLFPGKTRFGTICLILNRLINVSAAVKSIFADSNFSIWFRRKTRRKREQTTDVKNIAVDKHFWLMSEALMEIATPWLDLMDFVDSNVAVMGET